MPATARMPEEAGSGRAVLWSGAILGAAVAVLRIFASDGIHGRRFNASLWDSSKPTDEAARLAMLPYPELPHLF